MAAWWVAPFVTVYLALCIGVLCGTEDQPRTRRPQRDTTPVERGPLEHHDWPEVGDGTGRVLVTYPKTPAGTNPPSPAVPAGPDPAAGASARPGTGSGPQPGGEHL